MATKQNFSVLEKLESLVRLQKIDSKLDQIQILKGELPIEVSDLEDEIEGLKNRKNRIEEEVNGINQFIEQKKQFIKDSEELLEKYEAQSNNVKNSREFEAINKEIETQNLDISLAKRHIRESDTDLQEKARKLDAAEKIINEKEDILSGKKQELDKIITETEKEEKQYESLAETAEKDVEERLLKSYKRIRNNYRNGLGVVPVLREACGGCYNAVPPQRQSEIRQHKKIIICENCGRILVDEEMHEATEVK